MTQQWDDTGTSLVEGRSSMCWDGKEILLNQILLRCSVNPFGYVVVLVGTLFLITTRSQALVWLRLGNWKDSCLCAEALAITVAEEIVTLE